MELLALEIEMGVSGNRIDLEIETTPTSTA
jgi:hypothetical protein